MEASLPEPHCFHDWLSSMESKQQRTISFRSLPRTSYDERANLYGVKHAIIFYQKLFTVLFYARLNNLKVRK